MKSELSSEYLEINVKNHNYVLIFTQRLYWQII